MSLFIASVCQVKPPAPFVNDAEGFRQRAACVCVRNRDEQEVLLVSSAMKAGWIIPGGKVGKTAHIHTTILMADNGMVTGPANNVTLVITDGYQ